MGKARELLGFEATVELDEGLERTIDWYRENRPRRIVSRASRSASRARTSARPSSPPSPRSSRPGMLTMGPKVGEFERALAGACGTADAVVVSSGTAALHLAMMALGIGPGDEVIVPAYTFPATANAVELCGGRAVLVDVDPDTFNLDLALRRRGGHRADEGGARGAPLRPPGRLGGAADGGAAGGRARRGRRRRARRALSRHALRLARRDGLPLVPSAQDRHDRRGWRRHDRRRRSSPTRSGGFRHHGIVPRGDFDIPRAGAQLPAARPPLRDRDPAARPARAAARRARARGRAGTRSGSSTSS